MAPDARPEIVAFRNLANVASWLYPDILRGSTARLLCPQQQTQTRDRTFVRT